MEYTPAAYRLARTIVGEHAAPDVVQEASVSAWRNLKGLRDAERFGPWLFRIVVNRSRSHLRSQRTVREIAIDEAMSAAAPDSRPAVEARSVLMPALSRLSSDQKVVIGLHYAAGLSIAEVGLVLGLPAGTVKSRLNAALVKLRMLVQEA